MERVAVFVPVSFSEKLQRILSPEPDTHRRPSLVSGEIFSERFQIRKMLFLLSSTLVTSCYKVNINNTGEISTNICEEWRENCDICTYSD